MKRRHVITGAGCIGLASLAGCLGAVGFDRHEASPAGVDPTVREDTGYQQTGIDEQRFVEEVGAAGYSEDVVVISYVTEHEKSVNMGPLGEQRAAMFMVLSTPQISIAGKNVNPVEDMSGAELVEMIADNYDDIDNIEHVSDEEVAVLEESTTMSTFAADAEFDGSSIDVNMHVTEAVATDEDLLVTIGIYPERIQDQEEPNIRSLLAGVVEDPEADEDEQDDGSEEDNGGNDSDGADEESDDGTDDQGETEDGSDGGETEGDNNESEDEASDEDGGFGV